MRKSVRRFAHKGQCRNRKGRCVMSIKELQQEIYAANVAKGFHATAPDEYKYLALLHTEVSEATEEVRKTDYVPNRTYYRADGKPEGLPAELADVFIRLLDTAESFGIDLEAAVREKMLYNAKRPYRHGKTA